EKRYKQKLLKTEYKEGTLVLVRNSRLEASVTKFKTDPRYLGPYEVVKRTRGGTYILKELDGAHHAEHYAAFRLIPYITRLDPEFQELLASQDDEELEEEIIENDQEDLAEFIEEDSDSPEENHPEEDSDTSINS